MPLTEDKQIQFMREGTALWQTFLETYEGEYKPSSLFSGGGYVTKEVSNALADFCTFCAQLLIGTTSGCDIEFRNLGEIRSSETNNRPLSWLSCNRENTVPEMTILFDRECLLEEVAPAMSKWLRSQAILHEVGHFFHFNDLFPSHLAGDLSRDAKPHHEAEAWWFSFVVTGWCAAECACQKKLTASSEPALPPVWKLIQHY